MTNKTICRNDGRCEYAVQTGAEKEGNCPAGACANPAAHLTIPGALEWDGDNGTHGVVGTHSADGESLSSHSDPFGFWRVPIGYPLQGMFVRWDEESAQHVANASDAFDFQMLYTSPPAPVTAYTAVDMTTAAAGGFRDGQAELHTVPNQAYMALIGYLPGHRNDLTDAAIAACSAVLFPVEAKAACSHCGDWGHIETEDSAHDCPECGPSVVERAVEAGVMNAPAAAAVTDDHPAGCCCPPKGHAGIWAAAMCPVHMGFRRLASQAVNREQFKPKTCIECDQPYCHGVCVERGDQDYDRDQAAKGGDDE